MKIKKSDTVKIMRGKDRGKSGKVIKVFPKKNKVLIENLNLAKKHLRPKRQGEKGEIVSLPRPIDISNVMLMCGTCQKPVKICYRMEDNNKIRICKSCKNRV